MENNWSKQYKNRLLYLINFQVFKTGTIKISDDEDDTHPNIDTPSLFRWRHQARLERQAEDQRKKAELEKEKQQ